MKVGTNASCIIIFGYIKNSTNGIYLYIFESTSHNLGLIQIFFPIHKVLITSNGVIQNDYYIP